MKYLITPEARHFVTKIRFITPVSHHDPANQNKSNINLFLRRKQVIPRLANREVPQETISRIVVANQAPVELHAILENLNVLQYLATAFVASFINWHNGQGLLEGQTRYQILESRIQNAALATFTAFDFHGRLCQDLQVQAAGIEDAGLLAWLSMPPTLFLAISEYLHRETASCLLLARVWFEKSKSNAPLAPIRLQDMAMNTKHEVIAEVPAISANSLRHEMLREPSAWYLLNSLGLRLEELSDGVASLLYNGGDLNDSAPSDAFALARHVKQTYPSLALLGGSTSGFILGASNLELSAWLICQENNDALAQFDMQSDISIFDYMDNDEMTRHTQQRVKGTPMPFGFETLIKGSELLVDMRLRPYASDLEIGALVAALKTFMDADATIGGQTARGFGLTVSEIIQRPDLDLDALHAYYDAYLTENKETLAEGLLKGTLTTNKVIC